MSQNKTKSHQHAPFSNGRASTEPYSVLFYSYSTLPHQTQFSIPNDFESYNDKNGETAQVWTLSIISILLHNHIELAPKLYNSE